MLNRYWTSCSRCWCGTFTRAYAANCGISGRNSKRVFSLRLSKLCISSNARQIIRTIERGTMTLLVNMSLLNICILVYCACSCKNIRMYTSLQIVDEGLISMCWWVHWWTVYEMCLGVYWQYLCFQEILSCTVIM